MGLIWIPHWSRAQWHAHPGSPSRPCSRRGSRSLSHHRCSLGRSHTGCRCFARKRRSFGRGASSASHPSPAARRYGQGLEKQPRLSAPALGCTARPRVARTRSARLWCSLAYLDYCKVPKACLDWTAVDMAVDARCRPLNCHSSHMCHWYLLYLWIGKNHGRWNL